MSTLDFFLGREQVLKVPSETQPSQIKTDPDEIKVAVTSLSEKGHLFESRYGPISDEEFSRCVENRTPEEIAWEQRAAWKFYPKVIGLALFAGTMGAGLVHLRVRHLTAARRLAVKEKGRKFVQGDLVLSTAEWVENAQAKNKRYLFGMGAGALFGLNYAVQHFYPEYLQEVASMPNSQMALAVKRMHRQFEVRETQQMRSVTEDDIQRAETVFDSKDEKAGLQVPPELAASRAMSAAGSGYRGGWN